MNTTILTENSHPQATGGHRTGSSLNMPPKSWKDYVPRYVSLYYVDYNENLDSVRTCRNGVSAGTASIHWKNRSGNGMPNRSTTTCKGILQI